MFRMYLASAVIAFLSYGTAQYKGWSMFASEAQEFASRRAQEAEYRSSGGSSGSSGRSGGGFSGK